MALFSTCSILCDVFLYPNFKFLVACYATLQPALSVRWSVRPSIGPSICRSVYLSVRHTLLFLGFCGLWLHCSCPNDLLTSITAPAHPHATGVAMYPALFFNGLTPGNKINRKAYYLLWLEYRSNIYDKWGHLMTVKKSANLMVWQKKKRYFLW